MKTLSRLEQANYTFSQYESLNIDIVHWGLDSIYFESSSQKGVSSINLNIHKLVAGVSSLVGVSSSNIVSIKCLESSMSVTGVAKLNSSYKLVLNGSSPFIVGISYLNENSVYTEAGITISYANGTFNLIEFISGSVNIEEYIYGTANKNLNIQGSIKMVDSINGSLNIIEIFSGEYTSPQNGG